MRCNRCGGELEEGQKFCCACGQPTGQAAGQAAVPAANPVTQEEFLEAIKALSEQDAGTKAALMVCGTKVFQKELFPRLHQGEAVVAIANIHKVNIDKYAKEFFAVTTERVLEICKHGGGPGLLMPAKVKACNISEITDISTEKALLGEKIVVRAGANVIKSTLAGKGSAVRIREVIEAQRSGRL